MLWRRTRLNVDLWLSGSVGDDAHLGGWLGCANKAGCLGPQFARLIRRTCGAHADHVCDALPLRQPEGARAGEEREARKEGSQLLEAREGAE